MTKSPTTIGSLIHAFDIIEIVAKSDLPLKFTEIQELSGISKSNLYKYLNTLTQMDLLYRDKQGHYTLGYKFLEYGNSAMHNNDFITMLTPYFKEISNLTNLTTALAVWINDTPVITNIWNTNYGLNIGAQIGTKLPLLSAAGKMFAAYAQNEEIQNWVEREKNNYPNLSDEEFQQELMQIRKTHSAFAKEPIVKHVSSWSLPILNYRKELIATIIIIGFTEDVPTDPSIELVQQVIQISKEMSRIYGYKEELPQE
ncbi:IclR family transcriptional regulator [Lysinibacillus endophyticus]|uniref:IclR family transcriptional regulator n=1 Tax=Ureibacillus endophyticus TaxID=1978490 RepID=A0A494YYJ1_9BACL|nr:IclR family transcriptional regulator [Lysinibacillus endophyticus]MCP1143529.1 IclR family transcriptional regulator [Lysinibacillus endophyticus]RKQ15263.1 IclR family transcriptional regulator [Lysinibacillus endophyticus]